MGPTYLNKGKKIQQRAAEHLFELEWNNWQLEKETQCMREYVPS